MDYPERYLLNTAFDSQNAGNCLKSTKLADLLGEFSPVCPKNASLSRQLVRLLTSLLIDKIEKDASI
jgi:hypothetical protein